MSEPPWGDKRIDDMTDDEKVDAMLADTHAYMTQARAEADVWAGRVVDESLRKMEAKRNEQARARRERKRRAFWIGVGSIFDLSGQTTARRLRELREDREKR